jgi:[NiFe] hydrogenase assembly HybE family chaperone
MTEAGRSVPDAALADPSPRLVDAYRAVATRMEGLPFVNAALAVEAVAFAPWQGHWLGVLLTPWFMNLILAPGDLSAWQSLAPGKKRRYRFPAGEYDFIGAHDERAGEYQACSLFSPVLEFDDQETARLVARLARDALFDGDNAEKVDDVPAPNLPGPASADSGRLARLDAPMTRRELLRGKSTTGGDVPRR